LSGVPVCFGQVLGVAGTLNGRIFHADGVTPRSGVVVKAANLSTSQVFASTETDRSGRYAFSSLPSGQYEVAVEAGEGLYVNGEHVPVVQGRKTLFSMALNPKAQDNPPPQEPPQNPPPPDQPPQANPPAQEPPPEQQPPAEGTKPEEKKPEEKGKTPAEQEAGKNQKKSTGFWRSGWGVAIGLGGGAIVLGLLADSLTSSSTVSVPSASTP
jgi:carboxypeptidase family protein